MTFDEFLTQILALLRRDGRVSYRALKRRFELDEEYLEDLKAEIIQAKKLAVDEDGAVLVWTGGSAPAPTPASAQERAPLAYTPAYLAEKILASRAALEGERKQVTVLFADLKGSTELIAGLDPEEARKLLDPALHLMIEAVHRYEGTVNQVLGDGIMALFGAPVAHEDHALRACYAGLAMQAAMRRYAEEVRRSHGLEVQIRVGLNSGEVVVRAIGNDLHMDYSAVGQTTHLAARMEQLAEAVAHPANRLWANWGLGLLTLHRGDLPKALPLFERAVGLCQDANLPVYFPLMAAALSAACTLAGHLTDAIPLLTQAMEQITTTETVGFQALCYLSLGEAPLLAGRLKEAQPLAERALTLARAHQERGHQAYALRLLGDIAARREPPEIEPSEAYYRQAQAQADELGMRPLVAHCHLGLGKLYAKIGQLDQAHAALSAASALSRAMDMTFWLPQAEVVLTQVVRLA